MPTGARDFYTVMQKSDIWGMATVRARKRRTRIRHGDKPNMVRPASPLGANGAAELVVRARKGRVCMATPALTTRSHCDGRVPSDNGSSCSRTRIRPGNAAFGCTKDADKTVFRLRLSVTRVVVITCIRQWVH